MSFFASMWTLRDVIDGNTFNGALYTWAAIGELKLTVGFQVDSLTEGQR